MSKPDTLLRTGFALFSAITSFLLVFYAVDLEGSLDVADGRTN